MRVLTLNQQGLEDHARQLEQLTVGGGNAPCGGFSPDLVVGIATGGAILSRLMFRDLPHIEVVCRRPASERRRATEHRYGILRRLPLWMVDIMRKVQIIILTFKRNPRRDIETLTPEARRAIAKAKRILVVDDSVDSGVTLGVVLDTLRSIEGDRIVRSAAMTVTLRHPRVMPDYYLYHSGVLIRSPWSNDAR